MKMIKRRVNESVRIKSKNSEGRITLLEVNSVWSRLSLDYAGTTVNFWQRFGQNFVINSPCGEVSVKLSNARSRGAISFNISAPSPISILDR